MNLWMRFGDPLENVINDYTRIFDAWQAGGVTGIVVGRMFFDDGSPPFDPNPETYHHFGVQPPNAPVRTDQKKCALLHTTLDDAMSRGWEIWIFSADSSSPGDARIGRPGGHDGTGHILADEMRRAAFCARISDTLDQFPQAAGAIMDGPEWGFEIQPGHRSNLFNDLPESVAQKATQMGYDYPALVAAKERLRKTLHSLSASHVLLHASHGMLGSFNLFGSDPDLMVWFKFRMDALTDFFRNVSQDLNAKARRRIRLGLGPRSACFAPLCGYDFQQLAAIVDVLLPKHYFWMRGVDGLYGTIYRYVENLTAWNSDMTDVDALRITGALFGLELPWIQTRSDFENGFPDAFFDEIVVQETRRALAVVDDPERIIPWVDTGRRPHGGDPMTAHDLKRILIASEQAGPKRFLYHNHSHLTEGEWTVISELCGSTWRQTVNGYHPPDSRYDSAN